VIKEVQYHFLVIKNKYGNLDFYLKGKRGDKLSRVATIPAPFMIDANDQRSLTSDVFVELSDDGILTITPNKEWLDSAAYPVVLDPTVEITVLNTYSHPRQGENWVVNFNTKGTSDLKIIPEDQATIDDDEFVSLLCDGEVRTPQMLENDVIYYPNWECLGMASVIHYTLKAGKHTLRFEFGDQVDYAYNHPALIDLEATSTTNTTLSSGTYTLMDSMTLTPGAGDYLAVFSTTVIFPGTAGGERLVVSIYVNDVKQDHTERELWAETSLDGDESTIATHSYVSVGASETVEVWYQKTGTGNFTGQYRTLNLFPVSASDVDQATSTTSTTTDSSDYTLVEDMSFSTPASGDYLAMFSTTADGVSGSQLEFALFVDNLEVPHTERSQYQESSIASTEFIFFIAAKVNLNGSQDIDVRFKNTGTAGNIEAYERTFTIVKFDSGDIFQATSTSDSTVSNTGSKVLIDSMTLTPGSGEYLAIFSSSIYYGAGNNVNTLFSIYENTSEITYSERRPMHESSERPSDQPVVAHTVVNVGDSQDVEVRWTSTLAENRTIYERTLILIKEASGGPSGITVSGTLYNNSGAEGTQEETGGSVVINLSVATATPGLFSTTTDSGSGAWQITGIEGMAAGIPILVWVDNDATFRASTLTKASSTSDITGVDLYEDRVIVKHEGTSATSTVYADMSWCDADSGCGGSGDTDIQFTANANVISVFAGQELHINEGSEFAPGNSVTVTLQGNAGSGTDGDLHLDTSATSSILTLGTSSGVTLAGSWYASSTSIFTPGTNTVTFNATTSGKSIIATSTPFYNVTFNGASGGWVFNENASTTNNFTITNGTVTAPSLLTIAGSYTNNSAFTDNSGTIYFTGSTKDLSGQMTGSSDDFNDVIITGSYTFQNSASTSALTINSGASLIGSADYLSVSGHYTNNGDFAGNSGTIMFNGSSGQNLSGQMVGTSDDFNNVYFIGAGNKVFQANASTTGDFTIDATSGTVQASTLLTIGGSYSNSGNYNANSGTLYFTGSSKTLSGEMTGSNDDFYNLVFTNSGSWSFSNSASTTNNFTITSGTVTAPSGYLSINGDYSNSGTFTDGSGTVLIDGSSSQTLSGTMTGSSDFYNLILTNTSGGGDATGSPSVIFSAAATANTFTVITADVTARFQQSANYTFTNINLDGQGAGTPFKPRSSSSGTAWNLIVSGTQSVDYVDFMDTNACSGDNIDAYSGTGNVDSGGNSCIDFTTPAAGTMILLRDAGGGQSVDSTTYTELTWDTEDRKDTMYTHSADSPTTTVQSDGVYRISYGFRWNTSLTSNRVEVNSYLAVDGANSGACWASGYTRGSNSSLDSVNSTECLLELTNGDELTVLAARTSTVTGTNVTNANESWFHVEKIESPNVIILKDAGGGHQFDTIENPPGVTVDFDTEVRDDAAFSHDASSATTTVLQTGFYRLSYAIGVNSDTTVNRAAAFGHLVINNQTSEYGWSHSYLRGTEGTQDGVVFASTILELATNDTVEVHVGKASVADPGTLTTRANTIHFDMEYLGGANDVNVILMRDNGGGQSLDSTDPTPMDFDTEDEKDSHFLHTADTSTTTVQSDGLYHVAFGVYNTRGGDTQRADQTAYLYINNSATTTCFASSYNRGDEGTYDSYDGGATASCYVQLSSGDDVEVKIARTTDTTTSPVVATEADRVHFTMQSMDFTPSAAAYDHKIQGAIKVQGAIKFR
jgi:hypothetical protein